MDAAVYDVRRAHATWRWIARIERWVQARQVARLDRRLVPAETRFFDAYCRGGSRQFDNLVIDYAFIDRPRVRAALRRLAASGPSVLAELEAEFLAAEPIGDLTAARSNLEYLVQCVRAFS